MVWNIKRTRPSFGEMSNFLQLSSHLIVELVSIEIFLHSKE